MLIPLSQAPFRPEMTPSEEEAWCELIELRCGNRFTGSRLCVLHSCLWREMQRQGIEQYGEYYRLVSQNPAEWDNLVERLVNRETCFFRHMPSFTALAEVLLPRVMAAKLRQGVSRIALWSAGCSSGEEAYSMAIAGQHRNTGFWQFEVLGSDLSREALETARQARYGVRSVEGMPDALLRKYFAHNGAGYEVAAEIKALVRFEPFNFFDPATWPEAPQDVIFCHNVLIYFREALRAHAAASLARHLRPGGFLVPAPGELAGLDLPGLECIRLGNAAAFQRRRVPQVRSFEAGPAADDRSLLGSI